MSSPHGAPGIVALLQGATHRLLERLSTELAALGLSPGEINLLAQFRGEQTLTVAELVQGTGQRPSTVTGILDRLERRGLSAREINPRDRRSFIVRLTNTGGSAAMSVTRAVATLEHELDAAVSKRDRDGFQAVVSAIERLPQKQSPARHTRPAAARRR